MRRSLKDKLSAEDRMAGILESRKEKGEYRKLTDPCKLVDFTSNDYLGLSRSAWIRDRMAESMRQPGLQLGSSGSRLLTGNSTYIEKLEERIAAFHHAEAALIMNSGFNANAGLISTVARPGDVIFFDEYVHASIRQGIELSGADSHCFNHNDTEGLENLLRDFVDKRCFVVVESIYSMEGDKAPLGIIADLKARYEFELIVDEAHALGITGKRGRGLCNETGTESDCFARIYTFGKAFGNSGAVIVGSRTLKEYLVNFCKPLIYSTALSTPVLLGVEHCYDYIYKFDNQSIRLSQLIDRFKDAFSDFSEVEIRGQGPIFGIIVSSPSRTRELCTRLQKEGFDVRPIVYPTVPRGTERMRIILHSFNTEEQIRDLAGTLKKLLKK